MRKFLIVLLVLAVAAVAGWFFVFKQQTQVSSAEDAASLVAQFNAGVDDAFGAQGQTLMSTVEGPVETLEDGRYVVRSRHALKNVAVLQADDDSDEGGLKQEDFVLTLEHTLEEKATQTRVETRLADQELRDQWMAMTAGEEPLLVVTKIKPTGANFDGTLAAVDTELEDGGTAKMAAITAKGSYSVDRRYTFSMDGGSGAFDYIEQPPALDAGDLEALAELADAAKDALKPSQERVAYSGLSGSGEGKYVGNGLSIGTAEFTVDDFLATSDGDGIRAEALRVEAEVTEESAGLDSVAVLSISGMSTLGDAPEAIAGITGGKLRMGYGPIPAQAFVAFQKSFTQAQQDLQAIAAGDAAVEGTADDALSPEQAVSAANGTLERVEPPQEQMMRSVVTLLNALEAPLELRLGMDVTGESPGTLNLVGKLDTTETDVDADTLMPVLMTQGKVTADMDADLKSLMAANPDVAVMAINSGFLRQVEGTRYALNADYQGGMISVNGGEPMPIFQLIAGLMQPGGAPAVSE